MKDFQKKHLIPNENQRIFDRNVLPFIRQLEQSPRLLKQGELASFEEIFKEYQASEAHGVLIA